MSDYIMAERALQEVNTDNTQESTDFVDLDTGELVEGLRDGKFPWRARKRRTLELADIYDAAHMESYAGRATTCATWLEYLASGDGETRQLHHYNACKLRLCPLCGARKARIMANRLTKVLKKVQADHSGTQLIFLTLTVENCTGDKLRDTLGDITKAWFRLMHRRPVMRAVKGWFRAIEVTRNRVQDTYHPHIHAILVVEDDYFKRSGGLYITQARWVDMWQQSLRVAYKPVVGIQRTRGKATGKRKSKAAAATVEAAKYAVKDADFLAAYLPRAEAARVAAVYTEALAGKRLTAMGGWVKEAAQQLDVEDIEATGDLVHDDDGDGELTPETAEMLEDYGWHFGVASHVLVSRRPNPDFGGPADGGAADE